MFCNSLSLLYIGGIVLANFAERIQHTVETLAPAERNVDSWHKCAGRVCKNLMERQVTQSSCIFGCRAAMHGSLKSLVILDNAAILLSANPFACAKLHTYIASITHSTTAVHHAMPCDLSHDIQTKATRTSVLLDMPRTRISTVNLAAALTISQNQLRMIAMNIA